MAQIPPIGDAYIDEIIKAVDPYDPTLNKTQGVKLRELIKLMRDRMEQGVAESVAMLRDYTVVSDFNITVNPANYFDQPTTFIANRNSGENVVISFEDYAGTENQGKVYHIKNMGVKAAVVVSSAAALFDGEESVTLPQFASITIMSVILTEGAASTWAIMSSKGKAADDVQKVLTLNVNGLPGNVDVAVNGVVWPDRVKAFPEGTVLSNLVITAPGYVITPSSVPSVTMDADKTLNFDAVALGNDTVLTIIVNGLPEDYEVTVNGEVWPDRKKVFPFSTVLENLVVTIEDYDVDPNYVVQVIMDVDRTLTFTATNQGFSHIDTQWETEGGGGLQPSITRVDNSLFNISGSSTDYSAWAGFTLSEGEVASLKCEIHQGMIGVLKTNQPVNGQNTFAYGVKTETSGAIIATSWLNQPYGTYVVLPGQAHPAIIEMEFTSTEVIWYYGDGFDKLEWHRTERLDFDYYIGAEVYTSIENIKQKGFTATVDNPDTLLDDATRLTLPDPPFTKAGNKYTADTESSGTIERIIEGDGYIAIRCEADSGGGFYLRNLDEESGNFAGFYIHDSGTLYWEDESGEGACAVQPTIGQYVALRRVGDVLGVYITNDGTSFTEAATPFGTLDYKYLYYGAVGSKIYHDPQGINITNETSDNYIDGFTALPVENGLVSNAAALTEEDGVWTSTENNGATTRYSVNDGGEFAIKVIGEADEVSNIGIIGTYELNNIKGVSVRAGVLYLISGGGETIFVDQPSINDWVVVRYTYNANPALSVLEVFKTTNGIDYTLLNLPDGTDLSYISEEYRFISMSFQFDKLSYYPQYKDATLVNFNLPITVDDVAINENDYIVITDNNYTFEGGPDKYGFLVSSLKTPVGEPFILQLAASINEPGADLGLGENTTTSAAFEYALGLRWQRNSSTNGRWIPLIDGAGDDDFNSFDFTGIPLGRIRGNGVNVFFEQSLNDGVTWTNLRPLTTVVQSATPLYVKMFFVQDFALSSVMDVRQSGLKDSILLPDFTAIDLSFSESFTESSDNVFTSESGVETRIMLPLEMPGEGLLATKYESGVPLGEMMFCEINDIAGQFVGFYMSGDTLNWEVKNGSTGFAATMITGMFAVLRKTSTNILLQTTTDGISFTTVHDFGALSYAYVRLYAGSESKYYYPQGIGLSIVSVDPLNNLPGFTHIPYPLANWTELFTHVWEETLGGTGFISLEHQMLDDGYFLTRYDKTTGYSGDISISPNEAGSGYVNCYFNGTNVLWESTPTDGGANGQEAAVEGTYYGFKKIGDVITLVKTTNGVDFNEIMTYGTRTEYSFLLTWQYNTGAGDGTVRTYYPQGINITTI